MTVKMNTEKPPMENKLKLFHCVRKDALLIGEDELVHYDSRFWQVVSAEVKNPAIRLEEIEGMRPKKLEAE